jgi:hypothetical protein
MRVFALAAFAHEGHTRADRLFRADANQDGSLTQAEFEAGREALFERLDRDRDGALTMREARHARSEARAGAPARRFDHADANNNGAVSREEFLAGPSARFDRLDSNGDGALTPDEQARARAAVERGRGRRRAELIAADVNGDRVLSRDEFAAAGAHLFEALDANRDGRLVRAEAEASRPPR